MMELKGGAFHRAVTEISWLVAYSVGAESHESLFENGELTDGDRKFMKTKLGALSEHLDALNAEITAIVVTDTIEYLDRPSSDFEGLKSHFKQIDQTLNRELRVTTILCLQKREMTLYDPRAPHFGHEVDQKFRTDAAYEIDESGKCLALGRSTACVFHLMRVLEVGIRSLARCLGVPDPLKPNERNWGDILRNIKTAYEAKWPTTADRMTGDGAFFETLHATLETVRNPWRNATMHVENKYTTDEAEHIFVAVKGFMRTLASRCDEAGEPKA